MFVTEKLVSTEWKIWITDAKYDLEIASSYAIIQDW